jgi:ketosteroid isomerase-like protein
MESSTPWLDTVRAISEENIETARRCVDALNRRDLGGYLACCTDDIELRSAAVAIEGPNVGADGIRRFFADIQDAAPDFRVDVERIEAVGPDRVLAFERGTASGRTSGVALEEGIAFGTVYDFADGKINRIRVFTDRQQALEAAGLSE